MAATPRLAETVRVAVDNGATVRLAGDPRQLSAVGAGGGLGIVANAAASPRLDTLHRFTQPWEGPATLRLRDRDAAVLATYDDHRRIHGGSRPAMMGDAFDAWRAASVAGRDALMIAGDNQTVEALSAMARAWRVETGQVATTAENAIAGGAVASVGDLVVTRRNDRTLAVTAGAGGYVRNRDRWTVTHAGTDGSLDIAHLPTGGVCHLPASYVAQHVELGYATTAHGAQGQTVDESHVLVTSTDQASLAYVGLTRGRNANHAHVVVDELGDEPGHLEVAGRDPLDVLAGVLANDDEPTDGRAAAVEAGHDSDPAVLVNRYQTVLDEDLRARLGRAAQAAGAADLLDRDDSWQVMQAAAGAERFGADPAEAVAQLSADADTGDAISALYQAQTEARRHWRPPTPPVAGLVPAPPASASAQAAAWLGEAARQLETARQAHIAETLATTDPPVWAAALGTRPDHDPDQARAWAEAAGQVALYRQAAQIDSASPVGPALPDGHPLTRARHTAESALSAARAAASGQSPQPNGPGPIRRLPPPQSPLRPPEPGIGL